MTVGSGGEIPGRVDHRPFPVPAGPWRFYQEWRDVVFLHYRVDPALLAGVVPAALEIDLLDGAAWVSVVVFEMRGARFRGLPPAPGVSRFHEANLRTYVRRAGYPGVYFLEILASRRLACALARALSRLPYRHAAIHRESNGVRVVRPEGSRLEVEWTAGPAVSEPAGVDAWLTERYALHQDDGGRIRSFAVHHAPWPLRRLDVRSATGAPLLGRVDVGGHDRAHYSAGVEVVAWPGSEARPAW